ncbi:MAG: hypothetical protein AB7V55_03940 [Oscillospiraceae bacterium]
MTASIWRWLLAAAGLLVLAGLLWLLHPLAPVLLLGSLLIQLPLIWGVARRQFAVGYRRRAAQRRAAWRAGGPAAAFLQAEQQEADAPAFRHWSRGAKALSALCRAEALWALGRGHEAAALLAGLQREKLEADEQQRYDELVLLVQNAARFNTPPGTVPPPGPN